MDKKKKHKNDVKTDLPIIMDYGIGSISVYDPAVGEATISPMEAFVSSVAIA